MHLSIVISDLEAHLKYLISYTKNLKLSEHGVDTLIEDKYGCLHYIEQTIHRVLVGYVQQFVRARSPLWTLLKYDDCL